MKARGVSDRATVDRGERHPKTKGDRQGYEDNDDNLCCVPKEASNLQRQVRKSLSYE